MLINKRICKRTMKVSLVLMIH